MNSILSTMLTLVRKERGSAGATGTVRHKLARRLRQAASPDAWLPMGTVALLGCLLSSCASDDGVASDGDTNTGGNANTGGDTSDTNTGGNTNTGGDSSSGGAVSSGGAASSGGAVSSGGAASSGGAVSSGGGTGLCAGGADTCPCSPFRGCPLGLNCVEGLCLELGPDVPSCSVEELAGVDCHAEATCVNLDGNPTCTCRSGLYGDGQTCSAVMHCGNAEVQPQPSDCHIKANCVRRPGGPVGAEDCVCIEGFVGDGEECQPE